MSWGRENWAELDAALAEEADENSYQNRRADRKSIYRDIVWLTLAIVAVIWFVTSTIAGSLI